MSNAKHETIADIVAEMRKDIAEGTVGIWSDFGCEIARSYADRIEAAAKREREAGVEAAQACGEIGEIIVREAAGKDSVQAGNAAAMREALSEISNLADALDIDNPNVVAILDQCRDALAEPERNCDVGTAEEQGARHSKWCRKYGIDGDMEVACAHQDMSCTLCALRWAQMPYEEGGAE